jgi:hypothetical protein
MFGAIQNLRVSSKLPIEDCEQCPQKCSWRIQIVVFNKVRPAPVKPKSGAMFFGEMCTKYT